MDTSSAKKTRFKVQRFNHLIKKRENLTFIHLSFLILLEIFHSYTETQNLFFNGLLNFKEAL